MFSDFFLELRNYGIPVSLKSYINLQKALKLGLVTNLYELYVTARSLLVKSERYFDLYDKIFSSYFKGADAPSFDGFSIEDDTAALLKKWLKDPASAATELGIDELKLRNMTPDELLEYFQERIEEQKERHDFGSKWIGTAGTSPTGHSGYHPDGLRVGGTSSRRQAMKVAGERRFRDYSADGPITESKMMEALKYLRNMVPHGPRDQVDIDATIRSTMKNAGEIDIIFEQSLRDRLKVVIAIDNGGISMDPYVGIVKKLFDHAHSFFKDIKILYFHNTIYDKLWIDPERRRHPVKTDELVKYDSETRLIIVGDASMSPYELLYRNGAINIEHRVDAPGLQYLKQLQKSFRHIAWLNPVPEMIWQYTNSIGIIRDIMPMFEISLDGIEKAVIHLMAK